MAGTLWPVDPVSGAPTYAGRVLRQAMSLLKSGGTPSRPFGGTSGVRVGSGSPCSISGLNWTVTPHVGEIDLETSVLAGSQTYVVNTNQTGTANAAPSSPNNRIDILQVRHDDPSESDGTSVPAATVTYKAGTAGTSPSAPAADARCMIIATISVPFSGSPTITWVAPSVVAAGGILPVPSSGSYPGTPYEGQFVDDSALNTLMRWSGSAWQTMAPTADIVQYLTFAPGGNLDSPASGSAVWMTLGNVTVPTWATRVRCQLSINGLFCNSSLGQVKIFLHVGGPGAGGDVYGDNAGSVRRSFSSIILMGGLTAGSQSVTVTATFVTGTNFRVDANCTISVAFDFLP